MGVALQPSIHNEDANRRSRFVEILFETIPNGVVFSQAVFDVQADVVDFQVVDCNEAFCHMTGFSYDDMRARTMRQQDPDADQSGIFNRWKQVYLTGQPTRFVHYFSGADVWLDQSLSRFENGILACFTDVSHLKRKEKEMLQQAELLDQIGRAGQMGVVVMEAVRQEGVIIDFRYTFCNQQAADWLRRQPADVVGSLLNETSQSPQHDTLFALQRQVVETGKTEAYDVPMPGNHTFYSVYNRLGDGVIITAIDVTQARRIASRHERLNRTLQKQNDLLATVLSQVNCGVVVHDALLDGDKQVVNFRLRLQNDYMKDLCWQAFRDAMSPGELFLEGMGKHPSVRPLFELMEKAYRLDQPQHTTIASTQGVWLDMTFSRFGQSVLTTTNERKGI